MNDNDIIKALGYCFAVGDCEHCIYADKPCQELMADALDLINRQKAEIERLKVENRKLFETNNSLNYQVDVWNQTEAIEKFADKLKAKAYPFPCAIGVEHAVTIRAINDTVEEMLVKEMTEGEDA